LVAFPDQAKQHHRWVVEQAEELEPPLLVCEPMLAETMHLLGRFSKGAGCDACPLAQLRNVYAFTVR
jgi:hypothetical protein